MLRWPLALIALSLGCTRAVAGPSPSRTDAGPPPLPRAHIEVSNAAGQSFGLEVELALDDASREHGLMFRRTLGEDQGMLFVFPRSAHNTFWMKNTLIPLDMIFAGEDGTVVGVVVQAEPLTLTGRSVPGESRYVLEVAGGWAASHSVGAGSRLHLGQAAWAAVR